jgi:hypothetical protein
MEKEKMKKQYSIVTPFRDIYRNSPKNRFVEEIFVTVDQLSICHDFELISITFDGKKSIITWKCTCEEKGFV